MKSSVSSLDVTALARELYSRLSGAFFDKAYQVGEKEIVLTFRKPGEGSRELVCAPNFACLTNYARPPPKNPSSFAMQLRKELSGGRVSAVRQHEFDRILEFDFDCSGGRRTLVSELFSKGNVILVDENGVIKGLLEWQKWRARRLGVKQPYAHPPSGANPTKMGGCEFEKALAESAKDAVRFLALDLGLGGALAEEVCARANVEKNKGASALSESEATRLWEEMTAIFSAVEQGNLDPRIVSEGGARVDATPIPMKIHENCESLEFGSFNEAVDEYYSSLEKTVAQEKKHESVSSELSKLEAIRKKQVETLAALAKEAAEKKTMGDLLYAHAKEIEEAVEAIDKARKKGFTDQKIADELKKAAENGVKAASIVRSLDKKKLILEL